MAMKRKVALLLAYLFLASVCTAAYAGQVGPGLRLLKGPYLQNVTLTSIVVMWETSQPSDSRVDFGPTRAYTNNVRDSASTAIHQVTLPGLQANTQYHYRVASVGDGETIASGDSTFQTAVAPGTPFRFVVYGDTRTQPQAHSQVVQGIAGSHPRFVIHTGDLVEDGREYPRWQTECFGPAAELLKGTPLFPCLGNHEENSEWYYRLFSPPRGGGHHGEQWYSFDYGDTHVAVIDTDVSFSPGSHQYAWLEKDLKSARAEWLFVVHHHPAFSSGPHGGTETVQKYLVPLYEAHHVDMVFNGHDHLYERSHKNGVYYIVSGGGGAPLYPAHVKPNPNQQYAKSTYHFCTIDIDGKTATLQAHVPDGAVFDSVVVRHGPGSQRFSSPTQLRKPRAGASCCFCSLTDPRRVGEPQGGLTITRPAQKAPPAGTPCRVLRTARWTPDCARSKFRPRFACPIRTERCSGRGLNGPHRRAIQPRVARYRSRHSGRELPSTCSRRDQPVT